MNVLPSILCPIDFSDGSAGALRYAAAIASHFGTRMILLTVPATALVGALAWNRPAARFGRSKIVRMSLGPWSLLNKDPRMSVTCFGS